MEINGSTSDGYHTFDELYEHRCTLFALCMNQLKHLSWYSSTHSDGEVWEGWILCGIDLPTGTVTYHLPDRMSIYLEDIAELHRGKVWDGHTSDDVISRIKNYILEIQE